MSEERIENITKSDSNFYSDMLYQTANCTKFC